MAKGKRSTADGRKFPPAIRNAWGYQDAQNDKRIGNVPVWRRGPRDTHFDQSYVDGYYAGMNARAEV